uniref:Uncharacterized protein n=1 Tax=Caenorhabditis japonica TaxID=281687 RepID=A0A8R1DS34_CAEJA
MRKTIEYFDIGTKIRACIRDGAANAKSASNVICDINFDCFAHKINLAAKAGTSAFPGLDNVLLKLKKTCKSIRISSTLRREWEQVFDQLDNPTLMLEKHVDVRWMSIFDVLKRALFVKEKLDLFLSDQEDLEGWIREFPLERRIAETHVHDKRSIEKIARSIEKKK